MIVVVMMIRMTLYIKLAMLRWTTTWISRWVLTLPRILLLQTQPAAILFGLDFCGLSKEINTVVAQRDANSVTRFSLEDQ